MTRLQISGGAIALLGVLIFFITPYQVNSIQSGAFPRIVSLCLIVFGVLVALTTEKSKKTNDDIKLFNPLLLCYLVLVFGATLMIRKYGFYPAIIILLPSCLVLFGERNYKTITLFTIITTGMIYLIIDVLLGSGLP